MIKKKRKITIEVDADTFSDRQLGQLKESIEMAEGFMFGWKHHDKEALGVLVIRMGVEEIASIVNELDAEKYGIISGMMKLGKDKRSPGGIDRNDVKSLMGDILKRYRNGKGGRRGRGNDNIGGIDPEEWK